MSIGAFTGCGFDGEGDDLRVRSVPLAGGGVLSGQSLANATRYHQGTQTQFRQLGSNLYRFWCESSYDSSDRRSGSSLLAPAPTSSFNRGPKQTYHILLAQKESPPSSFTVITSDWSRASSGSRLRSNSQMTVEASWVTARVGDSNAGRPLLLCASPLENP